MTESQYNVDGIAKKARLRKMFRRWIVLATIAYAVTVLFIVCNISLGTEYGNFLVCLEIAFAMPLLFCMISAFSSMPKSDESLALNTDITSPELVQAALEDDSASSMKAYFIDGPRTRYVFIAAILSVASLAYAILSLPCFYAGYPQNADPTTHIIAAAAGVVCCAITLRCTALCAGYASISENGHKIKIKFQ